MKPQKRVPALWIAAAAGGAAIAAFLATVALSAIARPKDLDNRIAAVEATVDQAARRLRGRALDAVFPPDASCPGATPDQVERLRASLQGLAAAAGPADRTVEITPDPAGAVAGLTPLRVRIRATGSYESVVALLGGLSGVRPVVFVETVDLTSKTSAVTVAISGHAYCSVSA